MFRVHVVQAEDGESSLVEWGEQYRPRFALVDGGLRATYRDHLKPVLVGTHAWDQGLDLAVVTHCDRDHIGGILALLTESDHPRVASLWHNSFGSNGRAAVSSTEPTMFTKSIDEGNRLAAVAESRGIPINREFGGGQISASDAPVVINGLELRILGPTDEGLRALRDRWVRKAWDTSVFNRSGIAVLANFGGRTAMFTGDARGDELVDAMSAAGLFGSSGRFHVDLLSVPHHGAERSNLTDFLSLVTASIYVVSAGNKEDHPALETLLQIARIISMRKSGNLIVTNETATVARFVADHRELAETSNLSILPARSHSFTVTVE